MHPILEKAKNYFSLSFSSGDGGYETDSYTDTLPDARFPRPKDESFWTLTASGRKTIPAAESAIETIVEALCRCPRYVARRVVDSDGTARIEPIGPADSLSYLNDILMYPSRRIAPEDWWEGVTRRVVAHGNSWLYVRRSDMAEPRELISVEWAAPGLVVRGQPTAEDIPLARYTLTPLWQGAAPIVTTEDNVVGWHGPGYDEKTRRSPSPMGGAAKAVIRAALGAIASNERALSRNVSTGQVITADPAALKVAGLENKTKELREYLELIAEQVSQQEHIPVLPPGFTATGQTLSSLDLHLVDYLRFSVEDIARIWKIDLSLLQSIQSGVRQAPNEQINARFERQTVRPWARRLSSALTMRLLMPEDRMLGYCIVVDTTAVALGSLKETLEALGRAYSTDGLFTANESRRVANMVLEMGLEDKDGGDDLLLPKGVPGQDQQDQRGTDTDDAEEDDADEEDEMIKAATKRLLNGHLNGHVLSP